jgi:uncharacterized membrane protein
MATMYYGTAASVKYVNNTAAWYGWNTSTGTTSISSMYAPWNNWNQTVTTSYSYTTTVQWDNWNTQYNETEAQREARELRQAEYEAKREEREKEYREREERQKAAKAKAKNTFYEHLTDEQKAEYDLHHSVTVIGSDGRRYLIHTDRGLAGNVEVFEEDQPILRLCAHPRDYVQGEQDPLPTHDHFFAQMLQIMHDAEEFCRVAIVHWRAA